MSYEDYLKQKASVIKVLIIKTNLSWGYFKAFPVHNKTERNETETEKERQRKVGETAITLK